jgi:hypothetical protein
MYVTNTNEVFKQTTLYYLSKKGGHFGQGPNKNEFLLQRATISSDVIQLANGVQRYALGTTLTSIVAHLESEAIFGFYNGNQICFLD